MDEADLVIVIGKGGHRIPRETAMDHVFGHTIANDVTAPEVMLEQRVNGQVQLGGSSLEPSARRVPLS